MRGQGKKRGNMMRVIGGKRIMIWGVIQETGIERERKNCLQSTKWTWPSKDGSERAFSLFELKWKKVIYCEEERKKQENESHDQNHEMIVVDVRTGGHHQPFYLRLPDLLSISWPWYALNKLHMVLGKIPLLSLTLKSIKKFHVAWIDSRLKL